MATTTPMIIRAFFINASFQGLLIVIAGGGLLHHFRVFSNSGNFRTLTGAKKFHPKID
jgi:hypothetical protein